MKSKKIMLEQLDSKLKLFIPLGEMIIPSEGWIRSIRHVLGMSLRQLGEKMNITAQSTKEIEEREKKGVVSINTLRQAGKALGMRFVYGFIPENDSLESMIEQKAYELAREIVLRTSVSMILEDQENRKERIEKAIRDKAEQIMREMPRYLWN